ncbi:hypothetical protein [Candidatus Uabimicrobium amorphum]|uniref:Uncharacterized protein n=1 Tax=Uabimicrobium amorphum TaxID=2596890 RepID=A0A5S9IRN4_UABAM|nr:hypothetical protein [Candidatus Uabimicrobium amorphum]BBM86654.1 hypothetical protein UABAM_05040 [Candidatus Uabimicrobium amorphum]
MKNYIETFRKVLQPYKKEINDIDSINNFFCRLLDETKGQVILDFMDRTHWDNFEKFDLDKKKRYLTLVWHDFRNIKDLEERERLRHVFGGDFCKCIFHIKSLVPILTDNFCACLIKNYALEDAQVLSHLGIKKEEKNFKIQNEAFFKKCIFTHTGNNLGWTNYHFVPIFSSVLIPKGGTTSPLSTVLLCVTNINDSINRLNNIISSLIDEKDEDELQGKANSIRSRLENVLKVECCYRKVDYPKKVNYLSANKLITLVYSKKATSENKDILLKVKNITNKHSHDSGIRLDKEKIKFCASAIIEYSENLKTEIIQKQGFPENI